MGLVARGPEAQLKNAVLSNTSSVSTPITGLMDLFLHLVSSPTRHCVSLLSTEIQRASMVTIEGPAGSCRAPKGDQGVQFSWRSVLSVSGRISRFELTMLMFFLEYPMAISLRSGAVIASRPAFHPLTLGNRTSPEGD